MALARISLAQGSALARYSARTLRNAAKVTE
jgi:hypothetical protein